MGFFEQQFYGNSVKDWIIAIGVAIAAFVLLRIIISFVYRRVRAFAKKTKTGVDDLVANMLNNIRFFFYFFVAIYFGSLILDLPKTMDDVLTRLIIIAFLGQSAIWGTGIITYWLERYKQQKMQEDAASVTTFSALGFLAKLILWTVILLLVLENLGVDITALVAGLGVGGIAIALAVQNILGDLFASLSIVLDKPFVIGDFIIVDDYMGSVEHIGLKTTRLRSLSGEQLVMANSDLLKSRIRNYKRMFERRVVFSIGVIYQTSYEKVAAIPQMIREIIEKQELVRFDRSHFKEYGASSLNYETVYWVKSPDYNQYMDIHQAINLELYRRFEEEGIEFAYPTQTLFVTNETQTSLSELNDNHERE